MERYRHREEPELVHHVFNSLPERIKELLQKTQFVTGYSPRFLGLHFLGNIADGRHYEETSHCVYKMHQEHLPRADRRTTIILLEDVLVYSPEELKEKTVLHELGHALDDALNDRLCSESEAPFITKTPLVIPLTEYAHTNRWEAFATAFQAWMTEHLEKPIYGYTTKTDLLERDPATYHFFEKLKRGE